MDGHPTAGPGSDPVAGVHTCKSYPPSDLAVRFYDPQEGAPLRNHHSGLFHVFWDPCKLAYRRSSDSQRHCLFWGLRQFGTGSGFLGPRGTPLPVSKVSALPPGCNCRYAVSCFLHQASHQLVLLNSPGTLTRKGPGVPALMMLQGETTDSIDSTDSTDSTDSAE